MSDPIRTCVGCGSKKSKAELIRIVRTGNGELKIDPNGRLEGRGAYLCRDEQCLERAVKKGGFSRTFRSNIGKGALEELRDSYTQAFGHKAE